MLEHSENIPRHMNDQDLARFGQLQVAIYSAIQPGYWLVASRASFIQIEAWRRRSFHAFSPEVPTSDAAYECRNLRLPPELPPYEPEGGGPLRP